MKFHFRVIYNEILWRPKKMAPLKQECEKTKLVNTYSQ